MIQKNNENFCINSLKYVGSKKNTRFCFVIVCKGITIDFFYLANKTLMNFNNLFMCAKITKIGGEPLNIIPWPPTNFDDIWMMFD